MSLVNARLEVRGILPLTLNSKAQYEAQFRRWGFRKHAKSQHWRYAYFKSRARSEAGKDNLVYVNGKAIAEKSFKKEIQRHVTLTEQHMPGKLNLIVPGKGKELN